MPSTNLPAAPSALTPPVDVIVIDDEESIREGCRQTLESEGYRAMVAMNGEDGLRLVESARPRVVLLDLRMPGVSGIEVLERLPGIDPRIIPIVITGYGSLDSAVASMKLGAFDFITKPFDPEQLVTTVERALREHGAFEPAPPVAGATRPEELSQGAVPDAVLKGLAALTEHQALPGAQRSMSQELHALETEAAYYAQQLGLVREKERALADIRADLLLADRIVESHRYKKNALIQVLLEVQREKRWLPRHMLTWISRRLAVPLARILEIAHFYEAFSLEPQGRHTVQVCMGTACHVRRAPELAAMVSAVLGIKPGETDSHQLFTLKEVHCLGCCALAPVMKIDETHYSNPSLKELRAIFKSYAEQEEKKETAPCAN